MTLARLQSPITRDLRFVAQPDGGVLVQGPSAENGVEATCYSAQDIGTMVLWHIEQGSGHEFSMAMVSQ